MMVYEFRGFGVTRAVYTLSADALTVELPGPQVGKSLHEARIPVAAIDGFWVKGATRWVGGSPTGAAKAVALNAMNDVANMQQGQLLVAYTEGGKRRSKRFVMVEANAPAFQALVTELARLRPQADLRGRSEAEALKRLGMWSKEKTALVAVFGVIAFVMLLVAIASLTKKDDPPNDPPRRTRR